MGFQVGAGSERVTGSGDQVRPPRHCTHSVHADILDARGGSGQLDAAQ
jgi:hypothetical protein